jgi:hypothetical protein
MATFKQGATLSDIWENWKETKLHIVLFRAQAVWEFLAKYVLRFSSSGIHLPLLRFHLQSCS